MPSIESVILQKLLAELSAREAAHIQPAYLIERQQPMRHAALIRALWSLLWALSLVLCGFIVKYTDTQTMLRANSAAQIQSVNRLTAAIGDQKHEFAKMIDSIQGLAGLIAATSQRTAAIPEILQRLGSELKRSARLPLKVAQARQPQVPSSMPVIIAAAQQQDATAISMGGHHHPPIEDAIASSDVVVHHNYLGVMDYWLVPRIVSGMRVMRKVVPVMQSKSGTFVHDIEEVRDYIITPSGDWIAASDKADGR